MNTETIKIKLKRFRIVRGTLYAKNRIMAKLGLKVLTHGSIYDKETQNFLGRYITEKITRFNNTELNVLVLGSPSLQEIRKIPVDILKRFNVTVVDKRAEIIPKLSLKKYTYINENVFDFFNKNNESQKFDIILNRWFLHHISENNKNNVCKNCKELLNNNGIFIIIDWFIDDWETSEELFQSQLKFYEYRIKYLPHQITKLLKMKNQTTEHLWNKLHDDTDWSGGKHPSRKKLFEYLENAGFKNIETYNIADKNIIDDPHQWGDALIYAEK